MALKHRISVLRNDPPDLVDRGQVLVATILFLTVVATIGLRAVVSLDGLAPAVATLMFGLAAVVSGLALLLRRYAPQVGIVEIAGILTFVGVIVGVAIEPEQLVRLMASPERSN
jgi:hypothetical protein